MAARLGVSRDALASPAPGALSVSVGVDGAHAGELILADSLRAGTGALLAGLRAGGIRRLVLATGDRADVAHAVTKDLGFDAVRADLAPEEARICRSWPSSSRLTTAAS